MSHRPAVPGIQTGDRRLRTFPRPGLLLVLAGAVVAALILVWEFMSIYGARGYTTPIANDTLKYIWRSNLVGAQGLHALSAIPAGTTVNADRPGFPLVASILHGLLGMTAFRLAFVLPAVSAVLIGLGAATLAVEASDEPRWSFPVYLLGVGGSVNVALMSVGYLDNLMVASVLMACAVCALLAADGRRAALGGAFLLLGAALVHWDFAALFAAVLLGLLLVLLPESVAARRRGASVLATPSGGVARVLGGAVLGAGLLLLLSPGTPQQPGGNRSSFRGKLHIFAPLFHFGVLGPVAAGGAVAMAVPARPRRWRSAALLLGWGLTALVGYIALKHGFTVPAHRVILFALAIPILATAAVVGLARAASLLGPVGGALGALVVLAGLAVGSFAAHVQWFQRGHPVMRLPGFLAYHTTQAQAMAEAETAGSYVDRYAPGHSVIYVIQAHGGNARPVAVAAAGVIRDAIPPDQIPRTGVYLGQVSRLLKGKPTLTLEDVRFNRVSLKFWQGVKPLVRGSVVVVLRSFNPPGLGGGHTAGFPIGPGVRIARGPHPTSAVPATRPPQPRSVVVLGLLAVAVIVVLGVAGSGWAAGLVPAGPAVAASLAPAFGIAAPATVGLIADRAGLRLAGPAGAGTAAVAAVAGWGLWWGLRRRRAPGRTARE